MIKLSKLADYGIVLLCYFANQSKAVLNARELAAQSKLPLPTVSKILKMLCRGGLLVSQRGVAGGYTLARTAADISLTEIIAVMDGPIALTDCSIKPSGLCQFEAACPVSSNWQIINQAVVNALSDLTLVDMRQPLLGANSLEHQHVATLALVNRKK